MRYSVCLHSDDGVKYGAQVPDVPGCFGAGDTFDEALADIESALHAHFEFLAEDGDAIPEPMEISAHKNEAEFADGIWGFVDIDITPYLGKAQKINVTLPGYVIHKIEAELKNTQHFKNRSQFLAEAAMLLLHKQHS